MANILLSFGLTELLMFLQWTLLIGGTWKKSNSN